MIVFLKLYIKKNFYMNYSLKPYQILRKASLCMLFIGMLGAVSARANTVEETNSVQQQQRISVQGTVRDSYGALIGVSIVEKGTSNGTVTNIDGEFNISVQSANAQLEISYVG
jgi:hypothetical protein